MGMLPARCFTWSRYVTQLVVPDTTLQPFEWEVGPLYCSSVLHETPLDADYLSFAAPVYRLRVHTQHETTLRQSSDESIEIMSTHTCEYERPLVRLPRRATKYRKSATARTSSMRRFRLVWRANRIPTAAQRAMFCAKLAQYSEALGDVLVSHNSG
jgi:hypothetical protein